VKSATSVRRDSPRASRTRIFRRVALAFGVIHLIAACADEAKTVEEPATPSSPRPESSLGLYKLRKSPTVEWKLPNRLSEISGLATTPDGRLFAHDDERAIIFEIDIDAGEIVKSFRLGSNGIKADFEGIAIAEESIFLVTSKGVIYQTVEGSADEEVEYATHDTGIGDICEVEGLDYEPSDRTLLLACKTTRGSRLKDGVAVFRWSVESRELSEPNWIWVSEDEIGRHLPQKRFHPSGIARHPASGTYLIISAREHALIEIAPSGKIVAAEDLKRGRHPHAEGIAVGMRKGGDFDLIISNEGDDRRARLARYRERSRKNKSD
jgi:uncharacterized protein YjiK